MLLSTHDIYMYITRILCKAIWLDMINELLYPTCTPAYQQQRTRWSRPLMSQYHLFPPYLEPIKIHYITPCTFCFEAWLSSLAILSICESMSFGRGSPLSSKAILSTIHFLPTARSSWIDLQYFWTSNGWNSCAHVHVVQNTEWKISIQTQTSILINYWCTDI